MNVVLRENPGRNKTNDALKTERKRKERCNIGVTKELKIFA